ncbi:MAG: tetratricopeptide repeat protein [Phocaeicola sp.]
MYKKYLTFLGAVALTLNLTAQNVEVAKSLFQKGEYEQAKPMFESLVKKAPSNANYNHWYGVCCYETGDKEKALPYLKKSADRKVIEGYRYLGKLYADLYRYDEAVANYEEHIGWLEKRKRDTESAEAELATIRVGARMIKGVEEITVIDSFVVDKTNFLQSYKISKEAGVLSQDEQIAGTAYQTELGNKLIYSHTNEAGQMELYTRARLIDGWSEAEPISSLNTLGNVNTPFLMPDGITLYFAAQGEQSLGGYDLFVTRYNSETGHYFRPENMGMPFNSPANDYLLAIDEFNQLGWFASDRNQPEGKVCIYVFVPNESKVVYNYENTPQEELIAAASLHAISTTWRDENKVRVAKQRLAALMYATPESNKRGDFDFIIDDSATYHTLSDFRSGQAAELYAQLQQKQKEVAQLEQELADKRQQYATASNLFKQEITPAIVTLESRTKQLWEEVESLTHTVRNTEIQSLKK